MPAAPGRRRPKRPRLEIRAPEQKTDHHGKRRIICIGPKAQVVVAKYLLRPAEEFCFSPRESERKRLEAKHARRKSPPSCGNVPGSNRKGSRALRDHDTIHSYRLAITRGCEAAFAMPADLRQPLTKVHAGPDRERVRRPAADWRAANCRSPNQLRHTAATEIRHRFGLEAAQVALGHTRADVTQIYGEKNLTLAEKVAAKVG